VADTVPELEIDDFGACRGDDVERRFTLKTDARERLETND